MMISEFHLLIAMAVAATIFTAATMLIFLYCRQLNRRLGIIECGLRVQSDAGVGVGRHVTGLERELAELKAQVVSSAGHRGRLPNQPLKCMPRMLR